MLSTGGNGVVAEELRSDFLTLSETGKSVFCVSCAFIECPFIRLMENYQPSSVINSYTYVVVSELFEPTLAKATALYEICKISTLNKITTP